MQLMVEDVIGKKMTSPMCVRGSQTLPYHLELRLDLHSVRTTGASENDKILLMGVCVMFERDTTSSLAHGFSLRARIR